MDVSAKIENLKIKDLSTLKLLLEQKQVSKVAERLGISQPAMSRWFGRIRDCLQDPLLVRTKNEMVLTPVAEKYLAQLERLEPLMQGLVPRDFDPGASPVEFRIAAPDHVVTNFFKDVFPDLLCDDYKISIRFVPWTPFSKEELIRGNIHLAFSLDNVFPPNIHQRMINRDHLVCIARKGNPVFRNKAIGTEELLEHALVLPNTGGGWVNRLRNNLESYRKFNLKVITASYTDAFVIAASTDLITIAPTHVAYNSPILKALDIQKFPLTKVTLEYGLFWHEKFQADPSHTWLRRKIFPLICNHEKMMPVPVD